MASELVYLLMDWKHLTLSWRWFLSFIIHSIDLQSKSLGWFLSNVSTCVSIGRTPWFWPSIFLRALSDAQVKLRARKFGGLEGNMSTPERTTIFLQKINLIAIQTKRNSTLESTLKVRELGTKEVRGAASNKPSCLPKPHTQRSIQTIPKHLK